MSLIDVVIPELNVGTLTYDCPKNLNPGARVIVEVGKFLRTGFILGASTKKLSSDIKIKSVTGIIDEEFISDYDIWKMALWSGKICMCGAGAALKAILPRALITGEREKFF